MFCTMHCLLALLELENMSLPSLLHEYKFALVFSYERMLMGITAVGLDNYNFALSLANQALVWCRLKHREIHSMIQREKF